MVPGATFTPLPRAAVSSGSPSGLRRFEPTDLRRPDAAPPRTRCRSRFVPSLTLVLMSPSELACALSPRGEIAGKERSIDTWRRRTSSLREPRATHRRSRSMKSWGAS